MKHHQTHSLPVETVASGDKISKMQFHAAGHVVECRPLVNCKQDNTAYHLGIAKE